MKLKIKQECLLTQNSMDKVEVNDHIKCWWGFGGTRTLISANGPYLRSATAM